MTRTFSKTIVRSAACAGLAASMIASAPARAQQRGAAAGDSAAVVETVSKFHAALAAGDSAGALVLLTEDVAILESGGAENRAQYREHHLPADIAYAKAVTTTRSVQRVVVRGDMAWLAATSTASGQVNGRAVNSQGAETMILSRTSQGWMISSIHWSSRTRR